jgi:hypothetical protein
MAEMEKEGNRAIGEGEDNVGGKSSKLQTGKELLRRMVITADSGPLAEEILNRVPILTCSSASKRPLFPQ